MSTVKLLFRCFDEFMQTRKFIIELHILLHYMEINRNNKMRESKVEFCNLITIHLISDEDRINNDFRNDLDKKKNSGLKMKY